MQGYIKPEQHAAQKAVVSTLELEKTLTLIAKEAASIMKVDVCSLRLLDKEKKALVLRGSHGHSEDYKRKKAVIGVENNRDWKTIKKKKPVYVSNVQKHKNYFYPSLAEKEGLVSLLAVPLKTKGHVAGTINVYTKRLHRFTKDEIRTLSVFADYAAVAIENANLFERIRESHLNTIKTLAEVIDAKDHRTRGHSEAVMRVSKAISEKMKLSQHKRETIRLAGLLHDVGKVGVPLSTLTKPGPLTKKEWESVVNHPKVGSGIVHQLGFLEELVPVIAYHHERYDGKGYPEGLRGEQIPLGARILTVADAFDAMISERSYKPYPLSVKEADTRIREGSGTQFDPEVVKVLHKIVKEKGFDRILKEYYKESP